MDDLASMITQFLGSEEGMAQLRAVTEALGLGDAPSAGGRPEKAKEQGGFAPPVSQGAAYSPPLPQMDMKTLMLMQKAATAMNMQDKNTELLRALKPHFSPERAKKADDAIRIIQLMRLLPLAKEMGFFDGAKGGRQR